MSIDYDAVFGIGYEVTKTKELPDGYSFEEYLEDNIKGFWSFLIGNVRTARVVDTYYVVLHYPFKESMDLTNQRQLLLEELKRLEVVPKGEFGLVGGLNVS